MVIDFKNGIVGENPCGIKVKDGLVTAVGHTVEEVTFCNFPILTALDLEFINCVFENCTQVSINCGQVKNCRFHRLETLYLENCDLMDCTFRHLYTDQHCIICLEDGSISGCTFKDVKLENEAVLCEAVGDVWVGNCHFSGVRMDRKDKMLFRYIKTVGKLFKRKKEISILDEGSCTGLEWITGLDGATEIGSFKIHI